jgi:glycosyltransferase involved in cell wall biosynthesis
MDLTLIIPAYNEEGEIAATIEAAKHISAGRFREIIVVDNASTDRTGEIAREHGATVVREGKKGLPYARAAGLAAAQSEYIAYIDADHHLSDTWFAVAEKTFKKYPQIVALSGPRKYFGTTWWRLRILDSFWIFAPIVYRIVGYMILGGNFIARKDALIQMWGFDTAIQFYGEDTDIARRLSKVGKVMFRNDFYVYASARRFESEGLWKPNMTYALNYLWPVLFGRPYTVKYQDVRKV